MKQSKRGRTGAALSESAEAAGAVLNLLPQSSQNSPAAGKLFALQPSCTVRDSVTLRDALVDLVSDPLPVTLDVRAVERVDTAAMQVLCAFVRDRKAAGRAVSWLGCPESFVEAVRLLGMCQTLGIAADAQTGVRL